jgi:hypothetical protein
MKNPMDINGWHIVWMNGKVRNTKLKLSNRFCPLKDVICVGTKAKINF